MHHLADAIARRGGLIATHELHALGCSRRRIRAALDAGAMERIRQGWYAVPHLAAPLAHAARVGGRLDCVSAAEYLGLWTPWRSGPPRLHVTVAPNAKALRSPTAARQRLRAEHGVRVHWRDTARDGNRLVVPVLTCIQTIAECLDAEQALVVADSALHRRLLDDRQWRAFLTTLPATLRETLAHASPRSESGTETVFVHRLRRLGLAVRQQVHIPGVGRVDAVIGDRLVAELDSAAHHTDQLADRRRDAALLAAGYRVVRFMYHQVMAEWDAVERAVLAAIARGDHLR